MLFYANNCRPTYNTVYIAYIHGTPAELFLRETAAWEQLKLPSFFDISDILVQGDRKRGHVFTIEIISRHLNEL